MNFTKYNVSADAAVKYDAGLRAYMLRIFNLMTIALFTTGIVAYFAGNSAAFLSIMYSQGPSGMSVSALGWVIQLAPLFMVFFLSFKIQTMSQQAAQVTFWIYSVLMGLSLSSIFLAYTGESIARTFFVTASVFGVMSIFGYTTKKDLTSMGSFFMMGVVGIILASLVNMFLKSQGLDFAISVIGVLAFTGLTAYDIQKLKNIYLHSGRSDLATSSNLAVYGALTLYLDFINLFIMLLRLFGGRRD